MLLLLLLLLLASATVLEPPYHGPVFTDRPVLTDDGELDERSQALLAEKGWDGIGGNRAYEETPARQAARALIRQRMASRL